MKTSVFLTLAMGLLGASSLASAPAQADAQTTTGSGFTVVDRVSDLKGGAPIRDRDLVNAWGISQGPGGPFWISNNGTGTSTLYNATTFAKESLTVAIDSPSGGPGAPTGTVYGGPLTTSFMVSKSGQSGHSAFLFDTENGTILGWAPNVDLHRAIIAVNDSAKGAVFKGMAINDAGTLIYVTDFAHDQLLVYDENFNEVGAFTDPTLPQGYAPFNVQSLNGMIYVTFAKRDATGMDEVDGAGLGFVDAFDTASGVFTRLVSHGELNAPWGLAIAPSSFGSLSGDLLVGNFGDGTIDAYNAATGAFVAKLAKPNGAPLKIDGLWALAPGPNGALVFTAGPAGETQGLFGEIVPPTTP